MIKYGLKLSANPVVCVCVGGGDSRLWVVGCTIYTVNFFAVQAASHKALSTLPFGSTTHLSFSHLYIESIGAWHTISHVALFSILPCGSSTHALASVHVYRIAGGVPQLAMQSLSVGNDPVADTTHLSATQLNRLAGALHSSMQSVLPVNGPVSSLTHSPSLQAYLAIVWHVFSQMAAVILPFGDSKHLSAVQVYIFVGGAGEGGDGGDGGDGGPLGTVLHFSSSSSEW